MSARPAAGGVARRGFRSRVVGRPRTASRIVDRPGSGSVTLAAAVVLGALALVLPAPGVAQASGGPARTRRPDDADRLLYRVGVELGFLITTGEGFGDLSIAVAVGVLRAIESYA